jgi:NAD(P)-dependent dehydrogenase (short-subunit alcohol dehydrogenase family)
MRAVQRELASGRLSVQVVAVADEEALAALVAARDGGFDGLVNAAGYFAIQDFVESGAADWRQMTDANLFTAMSASKAVVPAMVARGSGSIVNFASTAGEYGSIRPSAAYAAAKGGVIAFTKSLAREVASSGVRVNCVSPGPVDTTMFSAGGKTDHAAAASRTLIGRMGTPADLAYACIYLLSDESSYVVGEVLRVNGGSLI